MPLDETRIREIIRDVLITELHSHYLPARSINPTKIQPLDEEGNEVPDGYVLTYDATVGYPIFKAP